MLSQTLPRLALIAALAAAGPVYGLAQGDFDPSFGPVDPGRTLVAQDLGGLNRDSILGIGRLSSGGYLVVGWATQSVGNVLVMQYLTPRGDIDEARPNFGRIVTNLSGSSYRPSVHITASGVVTLIQPIFVGARDAVAVDRIRADGSLDPGFGTAGRATITLPTMDLDGSGLTVAANGSIVVYGQAKTGGAAETAYDPAVYRLTSTGQLDTTFNGDGIGVYPINALAPEELEHAVVLSNNTVLTCGSVRQNANQNSFDLILLQLTSSGQPDTSFTATGNLTVDYTIGTPVAERCQGIALQASTGLRLVLSTLNEVGTPVKLRVSAFTSNGGVANTYGAAGVRDMPFNGGAALGRLLVDSLDRAIVAAQFDGPNGTGLAVARLRTTGAVDSYGGSAIPGVRDLPFVVSGTPRMTLLRGLILDRERAMPYGDVFIAGNDSDWGIGRLVGELLLFENGFE